MSDYEIGYRKPPNSTRFSKGKSGNPNGRPKGSKNLATILEKLGRERITISENGRRRSVTKLEAIVLQQMNRGLSGDVKAINAHLQLCRSCETSEQDVAPSVPQEKDRDAMTNIIKRILDAQPEDSPSDRPADSEAVELKRTEE